MKKGVYGENHPATEDTKKAKKPQASGTSGELDKARKDQIEEKKPSGGMGRKGTPK